jgi:pimeloyl-ACP methyl ester carboxylesterase
MHHSAKSPPQAEHLNTFQINGDDGTFVYLHGFGGCLKHWQDVARRISSCHPDTAHLLIELPGHGSSGGQFASQKLLHRLLECLQQNLPEAGRIYLVGHSLGGLLALQLIHFLAPRLAGLGLFNSGDTIRLHPNIEKQANSGRIDLDFVRSGFTIDDDQEVVQLVIDGFAALKLARPVQALWRATPPGAENIQNIPIVLGMDENDRIVSVRKMEQLAALWPHANCVHFTDTRHYPHLLASHSVSRTLADSFLHA